LSVKTAAIMDLSEKPSSICLGKQQQFWICLGENSSKSGFVWEKDRSNARFLGKTTAMLDL